MLDVSIDTYQPNFFDEADRMAALNRPHDPLVELKRHINFELFRPKLAAVFQKEKSSPAGRKAYDVVFMFKILLLQRLYNLGSSGFLVATVAGSGTGWGDENRRARPKSTGSGGWSL